MYKRLKPLNFASAASAAITTAVVLLLAASANAQDGASSFPPLPPDHNGSTSSPVMDNGRVPPQVPPPPPPQTNMPTIGTSTPPEPRNMGAGFGGTMGASPMNASGTRPIQMEQRLQMLADRQANIEGRRATIEEKRQTLQQASSTRRGVLSQNLQNLAVGGLNRVSSLLSNAITRMKDGSSRLRDRATTLQGEGKDVGTVLSLLDEADSILKLANDSLTGIDVNTRFAVTSTSPKEDWQSVRDQFAETRGLLVEAKQKLQEAIAAMKAVIGINVTAEIKTEAAPVTQ